MTPRLKTELWVQSFLRRCAVAGKNGAVLQRGHSDAGALLVVINHLDGGHSLLGPAPGPAYDDEGNRRFAQLNDVRMAWPEVAANIARARSFDEDLWVIEVEDRDGLAGLQPIID
jgi:hypothetical protein